MNMNILMLGVPAALRALANDPESISRLERDGRLALRFGTLTLKCNATPEALVALAARIECPKWARAREEAQFSMERAYKELKTVGPWDWRAIPRPNRSIVDKLRDPDA